MYLLYVKVRTVIEWRQPNQIKFKGVARGGNLGSPIEMLFQIFRLNFSWNMPKMYYFSNKFQKSPSAGALRR